MKIPKPGVDLFLLFFWSSRLRFSVFRGESCLFGSSSIYWAFLSSYRASKCHIPNNPFFNITLPLPNHKDGHFSLTVVFDWCWVCEGYDLQMMWYGSFPILYQVCWIPSWRRQNLNVAFWDPFLILFSTHCLFFLLHFTVMINISALNSCFPLRMMTDRRWNAPTLSTTPKKAFEKKATSIPLREFRISGTKKAPY